MMQVLIDILAHYQGFLVIGAIALALYLRRRSVVKNTRLHRQAVATKPIARPSTPIAQPAAVAEQPSLPYTKITQLLTPAEQSFHQVLLEAIPEGFSVFPQVRLAGLVQPIQHRQYKSAFYRIQAKTVDFVLCDARSTEPRLVIELDDSSHNLRHRRERDAFVDQVLASAGLPILHVRWQPSYNREVLAQSIRTQLGMLSHPSLVPTLPALNHKAQSAPPQPYQPRPVPPIAITPAVRTLAQPNAPALVAGQQTIDAQPRIIRVACGSCGGPLIASARFCTACGVALA